jgi:hypothetical protein
MIRQIKQVSRLTWGWKSVQESFTTIGKYCKIKDTLFLWWETSERNLAVHIKDIYFFKAWNNFHNTGILIIINEWYNRASRACHASKKGAKKTFESKSENKSRSITKRVSQYTHAALFTSSKLHVDTDQLLANRERKRPMASAHVAHFKVMSNNFLKQFLGTWSNTSFDAAKYDTTMKIFTVDNTLKWLLFTKINNSYFIYGSWSWLRTGELTWIQSRMGLPPLFAMLVATNVDHLLHLVAVHR